VNFSKKNEIHPFEDASSLEFFSEKQDASLFVVGTHSKKRPNNLTFARMFEHKLLDMVEVGVTNYKSCSEFKVLYP
jgi:ribosome production factor 2